MSYQPKPTGEQSGPVCLTRRCEFANHPAKGAFEWHYCSTCNTNHPFPKPKPTGQDFARRERIGTLREMKGDTKPTAEWTGLSLSRLIQEKGYKGAADAHNAALAEAKSGGWLSNEALDEYAKVEAEHRELSEQLSTERKKFEALAATQFDLERLAMDKQEEIQQLREQLAATERKYLDMERRHRESERQLAAERDVVKVLRSKDNHWRKSNAKLIEQLDAEREKVQTLVDALKEISKGGVRTGLIGIAKRALAKVKEGK